MPAPFKDGDVHARVHADGDVYIGDGYEGTVGDRAQIANLYAWLGEYLAETKEAPTHDHNPRQHRDGKPPWCRTCGLTADYTVPVSIFDRKKEDE
jgi:hypothetical protein